MRIRSDAPLRRWLLLLAAVALIALAAWLMFEYGRRVAGFDSIQATRQRAELHAQLDAMEQQQRELRVQLAADESSRLEQVRERSEVARTIGELQAQLARAQQDLQFYRGIANPQGARATTVAVQQFSIVVRSLSERRYTLRFALSRESRPEETVSGSVVIALDGERAGSAASVDLAAVSDARSKQIPFSFRYFTNIEQPITLPADFKPERVTVEVRPARSGVPPYKKTFIWNPAT
jgi:hypothetical protein